MNRALDRLVAATPQAPRRLYLALAAWTGIRSAEILRLRWRDVLPDSIEVPALSAKTRTRRLVPILPALRPWLAPTGPPDSPIIDARKTAVDHWLRGFLRAEPSLWAQNCLRHSYISYRLAVTKSAAQTALEAGTSERKIFAHYRALVSEDAATLWFSGALKAHQEPGGDAVSR